MVTENGWEQHLVILKPRPWLQSRLHKRERHSQLLGPQDVVAVCAAMSAFQRQWPLCCEAKWCPCEWILDLENGKVVCKVVMCCFSLFHGTFCIGFLLILQCCIYFAWFSLFWPVFPKLANPIRCDKWVAYPLCVGFWFYFDSSHSNYFEKFQDSVVMLLLFHLGLKGF